METSFPKKKTSVACNACMRSIHWKPLCQFVVAKEFEPDISGPPITPMMHSLLWILREM